MKYYFLILPALFFFTPFVIAQDTISKDMIYRAWIKMMSEPEFIYRGVLYDINESSVFTASSRIQKDLHAGNFEVSEYNIGHIDRIKIRRNNNIGKGILIGSVTGLTIGAATGFIAGDDPPCDNSGSIIGHVICESFRNTAGEKAAIRGINGLFFGGIIGALIGSAKIYIPISGKKELYDQNKEKLKRYSYQNQ